MGGRVEQRGNAETLNRGPIHTAVDYAMKPGDFVVIAESSGGAVVVTLPSLAEAIPGMNYSVYAPNGATADVSVNLKETGAELTTTGDLDGDGNYVVVTPGGDAWLLVGSVV
jgi:hypothetical protein